MPACCQGKLHHGQWQPLACTLMLTAVIDDIVTCAAMMSGIQYIYAEIRPTVTR